MKSVKTRFALILLAFCFAKNAWGQNEDAELLRTREAVWRAWFADDVNALQELVPEGSIAISSGQSQWSHRQEIFKQAAEFHASGGKLWRLEFPKTEVQHFSDVAITYSNYVLETEMNGKRTVTSGRVTEIFVHHDGKWTNPGWHSDSEK